MAASVLEEFLVRLGFQVDKDSELKFNASIAKATAAVSAMAKVVVAAGVSAGAAMLKVSTDMNRTFQMTQKSGTTMQNIGKFELAMKQMGGSAESARRLVQGLFNQFQNYPRLAQAFETITHGVSAIDPKTGKLRDTVDILTDLAKKLQEISAANPEAGVSFARELGRNFGMSEDDLNNLMRPEFLAALEEADKLYQKIGKNMEDNARTAAEVSKEFTNLRTVFSAGWDEAWMGFAEGIGLADTLKDASGMIVDNFDKIKGLARETGKSLKDFWDTISGNGKDKRNMKPKPISDADRPDFSYLENDETAGSGASVLGLPSSAPVADADADSGASDAAAVLAPAAEAVPVSDDSDGQDYGWIKLWGTSKKTQEKIDESVRVAREHKNSLKVSEYLARAEGQDVAEIRKDAAAAAKSSEKTAAAVTKLSEQKPPEQRPETPAPQQVPAAPAPEPDRKDRPSFLPRMGDMTRMLETGSLDNVKKADQANLTPGNLVRRDAKGNVVRDANGNPIYDKRMLHNYGSNQMTAEVGTFGAWVKYLGKNGGADAARQLQEAAAKLPKGYSDDAFLPIYRKIARQNLDLFENSQRAFMKATHYDPVYKQLPKWLQKKADEDWRIEAEIYDNAALYGPGSRRKGNGAVGVINRGFSRAGITEGSSNLDILNAIIDEGKRGFEKNHSEDKKGVFNRYEEKRRFYAQGRLSSPDRISRNKNDPRRQAYLASIGKPAAPVRRQQPQTQLAGSPFRSPYQTGLEALPHIAAAVDRIANGKPGTALPDATVRPLETAARTATYNSSTVNNDNRVSSPTANITVNVQGGRDVAQQTVDGLNRALDQWGFTPPGVRYAFSGGSIT